MTTRGEFTQEVHRIVDMARKEQVLESFVDQFIGMHKDVKSAGIEITPDRYLQLADDALWIVLDAKDAA